MAHYGGGAISAGLLLDADFTVASATPANVPGMATATASAGSVHIIGLIGSFSSSALTVGIGLQLVAPAGSTVHGLSYHLGSTAQTMSVAEQVASGALANAGTVGVRAAATVVPIQGWWSVVIGATPGQIILQLRAEVAGSVTLKANTAMIEFAF